MKKKISVLTLVLLLVLSLAGCGSNTQKTEFDSASMEQYAQMLTQSFSAMSESDFDSFTEMSDLELDLTLLQSGIPVSSDNFLKMIDSWEAGTKDCGTIVEIGDFEVETSNKEATLTAEIKGSERDGELVFAFDKDMNIESMTINAEYSLNEILKKAGMNTLLGMGTVFVILIFISFIISLFKYIPNIQAKFSKKPVETPKAAPKTAPVVETAVQTDDSELIAVIAAAIAAAEGTSTDGFVVRSIKRRKTNNWK